MRWDHELRVSQPALDRKERGVGLYECSGVSLFINCFFCGFCFFFLFLSFAGPHPRHMEVPRIGVELER